MSYSKFIYQANNYNDDINIYQNKNIKPEYQNQSIPTTNKGIPQNLNFKNKSSNINENGDNEKFKNLNNNLNFSSSLKDQILSPGDDDISPNYDKNNKISSMKGTPYLDDDIIFNQLNYHYLNKNKNNLLLIDEKNETNSYSKLKINSNVNKLSKNKKTLILDLDETLVHSSFKPINYNNVFHKPDILLNINFRSNNHNVYVLKRPYVHEFLREMNKIYNIIIFTASVKEYANPLLDTLDTEKVIKKRLFREECCIGPEGKFVKDLKILNMNLKDLILVDNNPISYSYNKCNGVPIKTWHFDKTDQELIKLIPILQFLANVKDVREYIPKLVDNDEIDFSKINFVINELNNENEQNKFLKPRAKSQKKFLAKKENYNKDNYGYNNLNIKNNINNLNIISNNNKQRKVYEESKTNLEVNNNKYIKNFNENNMKPNMNNIRLIRPNNNLNININKGKENNNYKEIETIDFNNTNKYINDKNKSNYNYNNNYLLNNNNMNSLISKGINLNL